MKRNVTAVLVLLGGISLAFGSSAALGGTHADADRGYRRAVADGVKITPAARKFMEMAPAGSCINDPEQAKCPGIKSFIMWGQHPRWLHSTDASNTASGRSSKRPCFIDDYRLTKYNNNLVGDSWLICHYVSYDKAYVDLYEHRYGCTRNCWMRKASGKVSGGASGHKIYQGASRHCRWGDGFRWWGMQTYAAWVFPDEQWDGYHRGRTAGQSCIA